MKIANVHRAKQLRLFLVLSSLFGVILLLVCWYCIASLSKSTLLPSVAAAPSRIPLTKNVQLAWPTIGQAAVGSAEDGLLTRSSENEVLRPTASMAKVVTALAIMEKQPFELGQAGQTYTLTSKDVENYHTEVARGGSVLPVYEGMVLTQYQAMQMMLLRSANNIADTLAEKVFGSQEAYASYAQNMLQRMGLSQTVITDPSGFNPATTSTPSELVAVGIAALKNPVIAEIVAQPQAQIPGVGVIKNTNNLLGTDGVIGIKTGTTDSAGNCLLFAARYATKNGQKETIVGVIMGDTNDTSLFNDSRNLLASVRQGYDLVGSQPTSNIVTP
jgi:D-alanyl-D-alanine carboxypeptidase (penicillin-binding protein 5/6)